MSVVLDLTEKTPATNKTDNGLVGVKPFLINVEMYDAMIEKGILNKYHKVELLNGKIYEKYTAQPYRIGVEMYDAMIEKGILDENDNVELLDGEIIEKMPKGTKHAFYNDLINDVLKEKLGKQVIVRNQNPIRLEFSEPEPDVVLAAPPREKYLNQHPTPSDILLIVEVSDSTLQFDRLNKGLAYAKAGIAQYLIVNVENYTIEDYRKPTGDTYQSKQTYKIGEKFSLVAFPEIEIAVEDFLQG
jgi:Uma2 family endonuclease